ncbi:MAG TPA: DUF262 domain-containing protein [Myxococcota bacterium]|nr:DUF262 domain-containing protein [Myxococcota bacterium]
MADTPEIKPQVVHLFDVIRWVREGKLRVASFQRPFRWDRGRMCDLFDSIRKQYPIGTLLLWVPSADVAQRANGTMGPLRLPPPSASPLLLLDGQQRVTTVVGVALLDQLLTVEDLADPGAWQIVFDASAEDLRFRHLAKNEALPAGALHVRDLFVPNRFFAALGKKVAAGVDTNRFSEAWQDAASALQSYRVPVVEFHTSNLNLAVESFTRLNRRGLDISPDEMFSALAEGDSGEVRLSRRIDLILASLEEDGFGRLDRIAVLRVVLFLAGLDPYATDWSKLGTSRQSEVRGRLPDAAALAKEALAAASRFLRAEVRLPTSVLLPYNAILVGLSALFAYKVDPSPAQRELLKRWVWVTAFGPDDSNPSRLRNLCEALARTTAVDSAPTGIPGVDLEQAAIPFPSRFDLRTARLQATLWAQSTVAVHRDGTPLDQDRAGSFIGIHRAKAWVRLFTGGAPKPLLQSPANRWFDTEGAGSGAVSTRAAVRAALDDLIMSAPPEVRERFFLSDRACDAYRRNDRGTFLSERLDAMIAFEQKFLPAVGVCAPLTARPEPAPIVHEDDPRDVDVGDDEELA